MILSWVSSGTTLAYLSRCSKTLNRLCVPLLYRHLDIVINEVDQRVKIFWNTIKKPFGLRTDLPDCGRPRSGLGAKYDLQTIRLRYFLALFRDGHPCLSNVTDLEIEMEQESPDMEYIPTWNILRTVCDSLPTNQLKRLRQVQPRPCNTMLELTAVALMGLISRSSRSLGILFRRLRSRSCSHVSIRSKN